MLPFHSISQLRSANFRHGLLGLIAASICAGSAVPAGAAPQCLSMAPTHCLLKVDQTGFRAQIDERGRIVILFGKAPSDLQTGESYVVVQEDLERMEEDEAYSPNEATQLKNELSSFDGAVYNLPTVDDLKLTLGFPSGSDVGARDYFDLVHVHMQLVLSVSALTAGYLSDLLGLTLIPEPINAPKGIETPASPDAADPTPNRN